MGPAGTERPAEAIGRTPETDVLQSRVALRTRGPGLCQGRGGWEGGSTDVLRESAEQMKVHLCPEGKEFGNL